MSNEASTALTYQQLLVSIKLQVQYAQCKAGLAKKSCFSWLYVADLIQQVVGLNKNATAQFSVQQLVALNTFSVEQAVRLCYLKTN